MANNNRLEKDSLGEYPVPVEAWYGIQTARAVDNFPISGRRPDRDFIIAHARIKRAADVANSEAGWLDRKLADAITTAADSIINGHYLTEFVVDRFQAGAGTSHNMNSNEVLANLANVALGGKKGDTKPVHPNDHVNAVQQDADPIIVLAALGGRLDQALANVLLLALPALIGRDVRLVDGAQTAFVVRHQATIRGKPGDTVSLIPLGGEARGVTTRGLAYSLTEGTLPFGPALGVSNEMTASQARIQVRDGLLLCVHLSPEVNR